jgi:lipoyl(octanoyl) transferase
MCSRSHKKDLIWYLRQVEEVVIQTLAEYGIEGLRDGNYSGVWVKQAGTYEKVAFVGVNVSRWITMHGFSINVCNRYENIRHAPAHIRHTRSANPTLLPYVLHSLDDFDRIIPCGIEEIEAGREGRDGAFGRYGVCTMQQHAPGVTVDEVRVTAAKSFANVFGADMVPCAQADLPGEAITTAQE